MTKKGLNDYGQVEDSTIAEGMANIEKPFRETPVKGLKKLFTSKAKQIIKGEKLAEKYAETVLNSSEYKQKIKEKEEKELEIKEKEEKELEIKEKEEKWARENPEDAERVRIFEEFLKTGPKQEELNELLSSALKYKNSVYKLKVINRVLKHEYDGVLLVKGIELDDKELIKITSDKIIEDLQKAGQKNYHINLGGNRFDKLFKVKSEKYDELLSSIKKLYVEAWGEDSNYNESYAYNLSIEIQRALAEKFKTYDLPLIRIKDLDDEGVYEYIKNKQNNSEFSRKYGLNTKLDFIKHAIESKYGNWSIFCSKIIEIKGAEVLPSNKNQPIIYPYNETIDICDMDTKIEFFSPKALEIVAKEIVERKDLKLGWFKNNWEKTQKQIEDMTNHAKDKPELQKSVQERINELNNNLWKNRLENIKKQTEEIKSYTKIESALKNAIKEKIESLKKEYDEKIKKWAEEKTHAQSLKDQLMK